MTFRYAIDPVGKVRMTQADKWKKRPAVLRYRAYADRLRELGATLQDNDSVTFYIKMPESWSAKKKAGNDGLRCTSKPDLDNLLGALMDAVMPDGDQHLAVLGGVAKYWAPEGGIVIGRGQEAASPTEYPGAHRE